jgi:hypothetical protein
MYQNLPSNESSIGEGFDGWQNYPAGIRTCDPAFVDGDGYSKRLTELSPALFCKDSSPIKAELLDLYRTG